MRVCLPVALFIVLLFSSTQHSYAQKSFEIRIDSVKNILNSSLKDTDRIKVLLILAEEASCADRLGYAKQSLALSEKVNWYYGRHTSLMRMADAYNLCLKNYPEAIVVFKRIEELANNNNDVDRLQYAYYELALINKTIGKYATSIEYHNKILALKQSTDLVVGTLANLGQVYYYLGDYEKAAVTYERALKKLNDTIIADKNIPDGYIMMRAGLLLTVADIYVVMRDYNHALENFEEALAINKNLNNAIISCVASNGIGECYVLKNEIDNSIPYFEAALASAKNTEQEGDILNSMANAYFEKEDIQKALTYSKRAITTNTKNNNPPAIAISYTILGKIYVHQHAYSKAASYLQKAIRICKKTGAKKEEQKAWEVLSDAYTGLNKPTDALGAYKEYVSLKDTLYNADKAKELTRLVMQGDFDRQKTVDSVKQADDKKLADLKLQRQRVLTFSGFGAVALLIVLAFFIYRNYANAKKANVVIKKAHKTIQEEKQVSENLLLNILPEDVADELKLKGDVQAKRFDNVTILFTDFVSFTTVSERLSPEGLVAELHACFKVFDEIMDKYGIEKIKTVGDAYLAVSGLPEPNADHATNVINAAIEIKEFIIKRKQELGDNTFGIRIGINSGTVVAGIVGVRKFAYDIWGDAVNTAARMEQNSEPMKINISHNTYEQVKDKFVCTYRGEHQAKNKGLLKMYFVDGVV